MLIIKQRGKIQKIFNFNRYKDRHIQINIDKEYVIFYYKNNKFYYELSNSLEVIDDLCKKERLITLSKTNEYEPILFIFSFYDENINRYTKYENKRNIIIGNDIYNDIYISDSLLNKVHMKIDTFNKTYINNNYIKTYINNKISSNNFSNQDIIQLINLKIIIHEDFIMVNDCNNIHVNLNKYTGFKSNYHLINNEIYIKKLFRVYSDFKFKEFIVKQPIPMYTITQNPLIFSIGPALTMSLASLLSGSISVYNSYMQGRLIIETIPMLILPLVMLISTLFWNPIQRRFEKNKKIKYEILRNKEFIKSLNSIEIELNKEEKKYRNFIKDNYLNPMQLNLSINKNKNLLFQKDLNHKDFLKLYIGKGDVKSNFKIINRHNLDDNLEKIYSEFCNRNLYILDIGIIIDLNDIKNISIVKNNYDEDIYVKYLLLQILTYYSFKDINLVILCDENWLNNNKEFLYINHLYNNSSRYIAINKNEVININKNIENKPTIVYIQNNELYKYLKIENSYILNSTNNINDIPSYCNSYIVVDEYKGIFVNNKNEIQKFKIENLSKININMLLYKLSKFKLFTDKTIINKKIISLFDILKINNVKELNIHYNYKNNINLQNIDIVLGKSDTYTDIKLDISEKGHGPHGLIAGMTGSGKSELIITLITLLSIKYSPKYLQIAIIDYKGGGIIQSFKNDLFTLPHLIGTLSNLDVNELRRCLVSFNEEIIKRQILFKKLSNKYNILNINIDIYQKYANKDSEFESLAHLLIIVDEFAELKKQEYEFMSELISIARIGRSLGIHLILSTQKPSGVVDDQIWSNCRFKICLKVQNKQDSYEMLHINDASLLKETGSFYLLYDNILEKGKAAWSNAYLNTDDINQIQLLDNTLNIINESFINNKNNKTQLMEIMDLICKYNKFDVKPLWLPPIEKVNFSNFNKDYFYLGLIDDYYSRTYKKLIYEDKHMVIFSINNDEKRKFLNVLLYTLIRKLDKESSELYIIDGLNSNLKEFYKVPVLIDILRNDDYEKILNLFKKCENIINSNIINKNIYIIINNFPLFKEQYENLMSLIKNILSLGTDYKIRIILFTTTYNSLHYQKHNLINQKISLINENMGEVMAILDTNEKVIQDKKGYGLIKLNNVLEFRYCELSKEEINVLINKIVKVQGNKKMYELPYVPNYLSIDDYKGKGIPIGINTVTYKWLESSNDIFLCGLYTDLIEEYAIKFNLKIIKNDQINKQINNNKSILWVGPGYTRQYILPINSKDDLKENEANYYHRNKVYKIRLIS